MGGSVAGVVGAVHRAARVDAPGPAAHPRAMTCPAAAVLRGIPHWVEHIHSWQGGVLAGRGRWRSAAAVRVRTAAGAAVGALRCCAGACSVPWAHASVRVESAATDGAAGTKGVRCVAATPVVAPAVAVAAGIKHHNMCTVRPSLRTKFGH